MLRQEYPALPKAKAKAASSSQADRGGDQVTPPIWSILNSNKRLYTHTYIYIYTYSGWKYCLFFLVKYIARNLFEGGFQAALVNFF